MNRRSWILGGALAAGATAGGFYFTSSRQRTFELSRRRLTHRSGPFALPPDFECHILTKPGAPQTDGTRTPDLPDGMACFLDESGNWNLLRNHELMRDQKMGAYPTKGQPDIAFDKTVHGGVSRLVIDPKTLSVLSSNMVLTGTLRNCAGGPTPWGWVSCEETTEDGHGYSFLCPPDANAVRPPAIIREYGRFRHEAVALDPSTFRAYLTEDDPHGCLYRFTPQDRKKPFQGKLEALAITGRPGIHTGATLVRGARVKASWVPVRDPSASRVPLHEQAGDLGAAHFARAEGIWWDGDGVVFTATSGGKRGRGQVFRLGIDDSLELVAEAEGPDDFDGPDNITVAPWGDFLIAEDGPGPNHVYGVRRDGSMYPILRNDSSTSELAGICFSPDQKVLFCNVQWDSLTVAIRGPWKSLARPFV